MPVSNQTKSIVNVDKEEGKVVIQDGKLCLFVSELSAACRASSGGAILCGKRHCSFVPMKREC